MAGTMVYGGYFPFWELVILFTCFPFWELIRGGAGLWLRNRKR